MSSEKRSGNRSGFPEPFFFPRAFWKAGIASVIRSQRVGYISNPLGNAFHALPVSTFPPTPKGGWKTGNAQKNYPRRINAKPRRCPLLKGGAAQ